MACLTKSLCTAPEFSIEATVLLSPSRYGKEMCEYWASGGISGTNGQTIPGTDGESLGQTLPWGRLEDDDVTAHAKSSFSGGELLSLHAVCCTVGLSEQGQTLAPEWGTIRACAVEALCN